MSSGLLKVRFGRHGPMVTKLGFGGIPIQTVSQDEAVKIVRHAFEQGIRFFDTARGYTTSEGCVGRALEDVRDQVVIATKSGAKERDRIGQDLETSLRNLRTCRVDLFMFHGVANPEALKKILEDGAYDHIKEQQEDGRIGLVGFSSHNVDVAIEACKTGKFSFVEFPLNYLETQSVPGLLPLCRTLGMGFIVMKPFAGGALGNARAAIKWLLSKDVDVVIPGVMSTAQVDEIVAASKVVEPLLRSVEHGRGPVDLIEPPLDASERQAIQDDIATLSKKFCRRCQYCLPCPNGIPVNFVVSAELLFRRRGWPKPGSESIADLKKALECEACGICEARCPYELPLATLIKPTAERLLAMIEEKAREPA
ncbi:MAG: aldo/keto reductase [Bacillota bacterium]|nr:aldo/keto reductase [Bacillota bacterium]